MALSESIRSDRIFYPVLNSDIGHFQYLIEKWTRHKASMVFLLSIHINNYGMKLTIKHFTYKLIFLGLKSI